MIKIDIKGDAWKIFIFEHEEFVERFGEGFEAFTDLDHRQVFFDAEHLDMKVCRHELFHVFASHLCLDAANLELGQIEEIYCEMFAKDGPKMIKVAQELFSKLRDLE